MRGAGGPAFDAVVERMSRTAPEEPALRAQFREAMDIWLAELLPIPLVQWQHRIAHTRNVLARMALSG